MEQGSKEWFEARSGRITASRFKDVLTKGQRKGIEFGATAMKYIDEILAAQYLIEPEEDKLGNVEAIAYGNYHEEDARIKYSLKVMRPVQNVGFITKGKWLGCSPDFLEGSDGGGEIKCRFSIAEHFKTYRTNQIPAQHYAQVQGSLYVTGRKYWDYVSYCPAFEQSKELIIIRSERDEEFITALDKRLKDFINLIILMRKEVNNEKQ